MSVTALVITNSRDTNENSHKDNGIRNYFAAWRGAGRPDLASPLPHRGSHLTPRWNRPTHGTSPNGVCAQKKGAMLSWHPFACSISVSRLPAIALSSGATATAATESTAATGTLFHRFRFVDR